MKVYRFIVNHTILSYLLLIIITAVVIFLTSVIVPYPYTDLADSFITIVLIFAFVSPIMAPYASIKYMRNCDPVRFLMNTDEFVYNIDIPKKLHSLFFKNEILLILLHRSAALCEIGRYNDAIEIYRIIENSGCYVPPVQMYEIHHNMAFICAMNNDFANARKYQAQEEALYKNKLIAFLIKLNRTNSFDALSASTEAFICARSGELEKAEVLYSQMCNGLQSASRSKLHLKVSVYYEFGEVKYALGKYDEAIKYLQFVSFNGGSMLCRQNANEMLGKINSTIRQ